MSEFLSRSPRALRDEHGYLLRELIANENAWDRLINFVSIEEPVRTLLRVSDSQTPNLCHIALLFLSTKEKVLSATAILEEQTCYLGLLRSIDGLFTYRESDIVSDLAIAAGQVNTDG